MILEVSVVCKLQTFPFVLLFLGMFTSRQSLLETSLCKQYYQVIKEVICQPLGPAMLFSHIHDCAHSASVLS